MVVLAVVFFRLSWGVTRVVTEDSNVSALRFRVKLVSVVNNDEVFELNDESNVLLVGNFTVESNDVEGVLRNVEADTAEGAVVKRVEGVLKRVDPDNVEGVLNSVEPDDGLSELLNKIDDVDDERKLDGLLGFVPDRRELVLLIVEGVDDKRPVFWSDELLLSVVFFVDKSEFVVDNNEDAVDGFFESAIFLIAQYCIILNKENL